MSLDRKQLAERSYTLFLEKKAKSHERYSHRGSSGGKKQPGSPEIRVPQCGPEQRPTKDSQSTAWNAQFFPVSSTDVVM